MENHKRKINIIKRLYNWVLSWAESKYGTPALGILAFTESSFFPIPPDVLQIALSISKRNRALFYALISTIFSVAGAFLGFYIGAFLMETIGWKIINFYHLQPYFEIVKTKYEQNAFLAIFTAAFTPIPYKVFTISAGVCSISLLTLFIASVLGRGARFFAVGILIFIFGEKIKLFIDKYFNILTILFVVLIILGFILIKYIS
ncbi:MAG TPA: YqaA family protein [bacterium]|nr:YqaA family protein [bacterium]HOL48309.1 YqaA family protein [bacterium]HPQ19790.1 YqaA family protein [bacterium]